MTLASIFLVALGCSCAVAVGYGLYLLGYSAGFVDGRRTGHDDAANFIDRASRELTPYAAEHFDARGYRRVH